MTQPISNERLEWLLKRQRVVDECFRIAQSQLFSMQSGGAMRDDMMNAVKTFGAERTTIAIELRVLQNLGVKP